MWKAISTCMALLIIATLHLAGMSAADLPASGTLKKTHRTEAYEAGNLRGIEWYAHMELSPQALEEYLETWWTGHVRRPEVVRADFTLASIHVESVDINGKVLECFTIGEPEVAYSELVEGFVYETWALPAACFDGAKRVVYTYNRDVPGEYGRYMVIVTKTTLLEVASWFGEGVYSPLFAEEGSLVCVDESMLISSNNGVWHGIEPEQYAMLQIADAPMEDVPMLLYTVVGYFSGGEAEREILLGMR